MIRPMLNVVGLHQKKKILRANSIVAQELPNISMSLSLESRFNQTYIDTYQFSLKASRL